MTWVSKPLSNDKAFDWNTPLRLTETNKFHMLAVKKSFVVPVLWGVASVVDDLAAGQASVTVKDLDGLWITLHAPVVDTRLGNQCDLHKHI